MSDETTHQQYLGRALELARQGIGMASPNPHVGAVIVDSEGHVAGTGVYTHDGIKHAEIRALEQAGEKSRGGTLYINLEPHSHQGRTSPCTDALIAAGIRRVFACMADPNPKVSGKGFEKLRAAGIHVEIGHLEKEARRLNEEFACYIRRGVPLVTLKSAMTLDGKIGLPAGMKHEAGVPAGGWITGEAARLQVQQQRHQSDAVMAGIGTVLADDPLLTDRSGAPRRRPLLRIILDSHLRMPLEARIVHSVTRGKLSLGDVLVFCSDPEAGKKRDLEERGIRVEVVPSGDDRRLELRQILRRLGELEITSVMIEGGSTVNGAALAAGVVDKVFLYYAPKIMAPAGSVPFACEDGLHPFPLQQLSDLHLHRFSEDFAVEGYLRDPYLA